MSAVELYHQDDPATSREAAENHVASGKCSGNRLIVYLLVSQNPGCTSSELFARACESDQKRLRDKYEVRRRVTDLKRLKMIHESGQRSCTIDGSKACTYEAV